MCPIANSNAIGPPVVGADTEELCSLIERVQRNEQAAFGRLYDLTLAKVYGVVTRIVAVPADAEEVTCDVYHQIWRCARQFDCKRGNVLQWITVIARSRALDKVRERRQYCNEVHLPPSIDSYLTSEFIDLESAPDDFEIGSAVHSAIAALNPIQIELVKMAFFQGLTHQEIASLKQLPLGTVKSHLNRAAAALRKALSVSDLK